MAALQVHVAADGPTVQLLLGPQDADQHSLLLTSHPDQQAQQTSHLLAALLAQLAPLEQHAAVADHVLQRLMPQLLRCQAPPWQDSDSARHAPAAAAIADNTKWMSLLCTTAAELYAHDGHPAAQQLATACVKQLEDVAAGLPVAASNAAAGKQLSLGGWACVQLLADLLQPAATVQEPSTSTPAAPALCLLLTRQPELLQRLLQCVIPLLLSGEHRVVVLLWYMSAHR